MAAHRFDPTTLREYDIRGIVGETLSAAGAHAIGSAFGSRVVREGGRSIAVGYDGRVTSPELQAALVEGLVGCGLTVRRVGVGPTPMLSFAIWHLETDAGIMVTGSHNPPDYNGFKMTLKGDPFFGEEIQKLAKPAAAGDYETGAGAVEEHDVREPYVARLAEELQSSGSVPTVGWDPGNGAAGEITERLCAVIPGHHHLINATIDGTFPNHHPDPTVAKNLEQLQAVVSDKGCELGIAFDGDGDRIGVIDGRGRILGADQLMMLYARDVLEDQPGATIVSDVKASQLLFDEVARLGGKPIMWKTGHSLIRDKMAECGSPLAGELSGHIFFKDRYYGFDDALYAGVRLLSLLDRRGCTLAALLDGLPPVVNTPELRFPCADERKFRIVEEVRDRLAAAGADMNDIDGVRVRDQHGWWLLRASNTQDVLVARCEASDQAGLSALTEQLLAQLKASGLEPDLPSF